jgi:hypothetical protein
VTPHHFSGSTAAQWGHRCVLLCVLRPLHCTPTCRTTTLTSLFSREHPDGLAHTDVSHKRNTLTVSFPSVCVCCLCHPHACPPVSHLGSEHTIVGLTCACVCARRLTTVDSCALPANAHTRTMSAQMPPLLGQFLCVVCSLLTNNNFLWGLFALHRMQDLSTPPGAPPSLAMPMVVTPRPHRG